jgi:uncharacterized protein (TIGR00369 family)
MTLARYDGLPPFAELLGLRVQDQTGDALTILMPASQTLDNRKGDVHGGAIATLMDTALGLAARGSDDWRVVSSTLNLTINYLSPGRGDLTCKTTVQRRGKSVVFVEGTVTDSYGTVIAVGMGTYKTYHPK